MKARGTSSDSAGRARTIGVVMSLGLVLIGLALAWANKLPGIPAEGQLVPFVSTLVGISFYVLNNVRKRRERFDLYYVPDYTFRAAQAVVYLYAILAIFDYLRHAPDAHPAGELLRWPPNLIGLLVGMYILHVERAMEGLGYRFEEVLTAILGRSLALPTRREKDIALIQAEGRFREIQQQAELMAAEAGPPALAEGFKERFRRVSDAIDERDHDAAVREVAELSLDFETTKQAIRREALTVRKVLGLVESASLGTVRPRKKA